MRLWSLHPMYLDQQGLGALWREGLLAKKVLMGHTVGYRDHPQLQRFKDLVNPVQGILSYLQHVYTEASLRGYNYDSNKLVGWCPLNYQVIVTEKQLKFEYKHLLEKLKARSPKDFERVQNFKFLRANPFFYVVAGGEVAPWEKDPSAQWFRG